MKIPRETLCFVSETNPQTGRFLSDVVHAFCMNWKELGLTGTISLLRRNGARSKAGRREGRNQLKKKSILKKQGGG